MVHEASLERLKGFLEEEGNLVIVTLGNEFATDDGVGLVIGNELMEAGIDVVEGGRLLLGKLEEIEEHSPARVLFIDAANMGLGPGEWRTVEAGQVVELGLSTHENNLAVVMGYLGGKFPGIEFLFLGIQFGSMEMSEGLTITDPVATTAKEIVKIIKEIK